MTAQSAPPKTLGIRHVALRVRDLPAMERFYREILGYGLEWRPDEGSVYLTRDSDTLALHQDETLIPGGHAGALDHFGLFLNKPEDVDAWAGHIKSMGVSLQKEPKTHRDGSRSFYVLDPEGNCIQFLYHPPWK